MDYPFHWIEGGTVSISATTSSANVALTKVPTGRFQIRLYNAGPSTVFIKKGADNTVAAATTDLPIPSGAVEVLTINNNPSAPMGFIAGITATSTATLYISMGAGE